MSIVRIARVVAVSGLAMVVAGLAAGAANADVFMKLPGAAGDVTVKGFEQQVALTGASLSVSTIPSYSPDGEVNGRMTNAGPIVLSKAPDRSSPRLMQAALSNAQLGTVEITFTAPRVPGQPVVTQYKWVLEGVRVNGFSVYPTGVVGEAPQESIELSYTSLRYQVVTPGKPGGTEEIRIEAPDGGSFGTEAVGCGCLPSSTSLG